MNDGYLFADPRNMSDEELELEQEHFNNGYVAKLLNDPSISDYVKSELVMHGQRVKNECARRDDIAIIPLEAFGITDFF